MTDFVYFTVTGNFKVLQTDMQDAGGEPDFGTITGLVTFTPLPSIVESTTLTPMATVLLEPCVGRIEDDGRLKTLDSAPIYYLDGATRNPCPEGLEPVFVEYIPAYWKDEQGNHTPNPDGDPIFGVRLVANTAALGPLSTFQYRVDFTHVVYNKKERNIPSFVFDAPDADVALDLATLMSA